MVRHTNTKRAIMDLAEAFLQDRGFNGFSYAHIARELQIKNAAVHYHFPTKDALVCAVIQRYRDRFQLWTKNARIRELSPRAKLDWFFDIYTTTRADNGKVCLAGSLETEFHSLPPALREQIELLTRELLGWLQSTLEEGRDAGMFHFEGDAATRAALILASLQGALQMARAVGTGPFEAIVEQYRRDLNGRT